MEKIASFTIHHLTLEPGVYVSRKDRDPQTGAVVTTFDLRMTAPNREPVMNTAELHTIEHLCATFLRNDPEWSGRVVYFGPMGCRTGNYLVLFGDYESADVIGLVTRMFEFVRDFAGDVPGAARRYDARTDLAATTSTPVPHTSATMTSPVATGAVARASYTRSRHLRSSSRGMAELLTTGSLRMSAPSSLTVVVRVLMGWVCSLVA